MKIKLLTLAIALLFTGNLFAQSQTKNEALHAYLLMSKQQRHQLKIKSLIPSEMKHESKKTRSGSRLIASATQDLISSVPPNIVLSDSLHYSYTAGYGFDITPELFSPQIDLTSLTSADKQYYDSSVMWQNDGSGSLVVSDSVICKFAADHKLTNENTTYFNPPLWSGISYLYNASGQRIQELDSIIQGGTTYIDRYTFTYDGFNHLKTVQQDEWDPATTSFISLYLDSLFYDANFNLITIKDFDYDVPSSSWVKAYLISATYNAANKVTNELYQFWEPTTNSWVNDTKTEYVLNGSNQVVSATNSNWDISLTNWLYSDKDSFQYTSSNYPSMKIHQNWNTSTNSMENVTKDVYTYNSSNQILQDHLSLWDGSSAWMDYNHTNYYYETFIPAGIKETVSNSGSLKLYPVPSSGLLHVDGKWNETQTSTLQINDVAGKLMKQINLPSFASFSQTIDISSFPAGNYILKINGEKGMMTQLITKQ